MWKYAIMAFIQHMASVGSLEKSAGSAALSSVVQVDMGVAGGAGGAGGAGIVFGGAGAKACCLCGLGLLQ